MHLKYFEVTNLPSLQNYTIYKKEYTKKQTNKKNKKKKKKTIEKKSKEWKIRDNHNIFYFRRWWPPYNNRGDGRMNIPSPAITCG
jgi:hypothetical protein